MTGTVAANFTSNRSGTLECSVKISENNNVPKHENSLTQKKLLIS